MSKQKEIGVAKSERNLVLFLTFIRDIGQEALETVFPFVFLLSAFLLFPRRLIFASPSIFRLFSEAVSILYRR
jgi:hypothetical protein